MFYLCFEQLSWQNTSENEFWMVDLGFLLFSSTFPFIAFFSNTCICELWMVTSGFPSFLFPFSYIVLPKFLFKNLHLQNFSQPNFSQWWIPTFLNSQPTFLATCPFQTAARMNFGCLDFHLSFQSSVLHLFGKETLKGKLHMRKVGIQGLTVQNLQMHAFEMNVERNMRWRCRAHHKYTLNFEHPFKIQSFHGSMGYSIYSSAQLSWHNRGENEVWEKKETKILPSEVRNCRCLRRKLWKEKWMRKVGIQDRPSKIHFH